MDEIAFVRARLDEVEAGAEAPTPTRMARALRAILEEHEPRTCTQGPLEGKLICGAESPYDDEFYATQWPCGTVSALAGVWADHPEYGAITTPPVE